MDRRHLLERLWWCCVVLCGVCRMEVSVEEGGDRREEVIEKSTHHPHCESPNTVLGCVKPPASASLTPVVHCRAITRVYLELCERRLVKMGVRCGDLRLVDFSCYDVYGVVALSCAFFDLVFSRCPLQQRNTYFDTLAGKLCITSLLTLSLKFCKCDPFVTIPSERGGYMSVTTILHKLMFGELQPMYGKQLAVDLLWETEASLLKRLGGSLYSLFFTCVSSRVEALLEDALERATGKAERDAVLKCRNLATVYATSLHCVDELAEPVLAAALRTGSENVLLARVALLVATQSLVAADVALPTSLRPLNEHHDATEVMLALRLLNYCRKNTAHVPLVDTARRDICCGNLFSDATQSKALQTLIVKSATVAHSSQPR